MKQGLPGVPTVFKWVEEVRRASPTFKLSS